MPPEPRHLLVAAVALAAACASSPAAKAPAPDVTEVAADPPAADVTPSEDASEAAAPSREVYHRADVPGTTLTVTWLVPEGETLEARGTFDAPVGERLTFDHGLDCELRDTSAPGWSRARSFCQTPDAMFSPDGAFAAMTTPDGDPSDVVAVPTGALRAFADGDLSGAVPLPQLITEDTGGLITKFAWTGPTTMAYEMACCGTNNLYVYDVVDRVRAHLSTHGHSEYRRDNKTRSFSPNRRWFVINAVDHGGATLLVYDGEDVDALMRGEEVEPHRVVRRGDYLGPLVEWKGEDAFVVLEWSDPETSKEVTVTLSP